MPSSIVSRISRSRFASTAAAAILSTSIGVFGWQDGAIAQSTPYTSTVTCTNPPIPPVRTNRPDPTWEPDTGGILPVVAVDEREHRSRRRTVSAVVFSPDGAVLASGGAESVINIWDTRTIQDASPSAPILQAISLQENEQVLSLAFSPDGNCLASGGRNGEVRLWDWRTGRFRTLAERDPADSLTNVQSLAFTSDGQILASSSLEGYVHFWNVSDGSLLQTIAVNPGVEELVFAPDGTTITVMSITGDMTVWDWRRGEPPLVPSRPTQSNSEALAISPSGQLLAFGSFRGSPSGVTVESPDQNNSIYLINAHDLTQIGEPLRGHTESVRDLDFNPRGSQLLSASSDATARIWDVQRQILIRVFELEQNTRTMYQSLGSPIFSASFHPSGRAFAVGRYDGSIQLYISQD